MRITECNEKQMLQRFMWTGDGPITVASSPDLCLVFKGITANVGVDPIILQLCSRIPAERLRWTAKFV
jgi:hypothetical protein